MAGDLIFVAEDNEKSLKLFPGRPSQAMRGNRRRFLRAGLNGYLSKPVNIVELISVMEEHCRGSGR